MNSSLRILCALAALSFANAAFAQLTFDARNLPYSNFPAITNANVRSETDIRSTALTQAAGAYRAQFGMFALSHLPPGSTFKLIYTDGSSENGIVNNQTGSYGSVPVPGTQRDEDGNLIGGSGGGGGGGGGPYFGIIGYRPVYVSATVCSAGICTTEQVLVGYEPIYGHYYRER